MKHLANYQHEVDNGQTIESVSTDFFETRTAAGSSFPWSLLRIFLSLAFILKC